MKKLLLLPALLTVSLLAQTFNVSTTPELRTALTTAATNGEDDTIVLADGTYKTTDDGQGTFTITELDSRMLTLRGTSSISTILSGEGLNTILRHSSVDHKSVLLLEELSFVNGYNEIDRGSGIVTNSILKVNDCNFTNNYAKEGGGAIYSSHYTSDTNYKQFLTRTIFKNNSSWIGYGGGVWIRSTAEINSCQFIENSGYQGGALGIDNRSLIYNSVFSKNTATIGGAISIAFGSNSSSIFNNIFYENNNSVYLRSGYDAKVFNNVFKNNANYDIEIGTELPYITHNFIDTDKIIGDYVSFENIFGSTDLGFLDEENNDFRLTSDSSLIDLGCIDYFTDLNASAEVIINGTIVSSAYALLLPNTDIQGNARLSGGNIDIGSYEFSTNRPTINSLFFTGIAREFSTLTFSVDYTLSNERTINTIKTTLL